MAELLTAAQMRAIETAAIESGEVTGLELMERAGRGVVEAVFEEWPEYRHAPQSAAILCGPGNNGGDGFVVARLLAGKGWRVRVFLYGDPEKLPPDARTNYEIWTGEGDVEELSERAFRAEPHTLYIDALFGTGLKRPLEGAALDVITHMAGRNGDNYSDDTVCIDAPSGLCMDSGRIIGSSQVGFAHGMNRFARLTVAFDSPKAGHFLGAGPGLCGKLVVKDIGLVNWRAFQPRPGAKPGEKPFTVRDGFASGVIRPPRLELNGPDHLVPDPRYDAMPNRSWYALGKLRRDGTVHKYAYGHAVILSGGAGRTGAARLAARGALRIGAGLVTVASPPAAMAENAAQLTAIMLRQVADAAALTGMLADQRLSALCLGPGMGVGAETRGMVGAALETRRRALLDADALTSFAEDPAALFALTHEDVVLTPHDGEFARLFPDIAEKLSGPARPVPPGYHDAIRDGNVRFKQDLAAYNEALSGQRGPVFSRVDAAREAAARAGCTVLLKGPDTVIADQIGRAAVNAAVYDRAAPWLATAGSGDVLAGFVTGLMASHRAPYEAARLGTWLHVECARSFGPGLIAEDLPEELPKVFRGLGEL